MATGDAFVAVAEAVKAVGLRGAIRFYPLLDWHEPLLGTGYLEWADGRPFQAEQWRADGSCWVVKAAGVASREGAEAVVGSEIGFRRRSYAERAFPKPDDGLPFRYLGRSVATVAGQAIGRVVEVRRYATQLLLVVRAGARDHLVPAVPPILQPDHGLEGTLLIDPPPGLIDDAAVVVAAGADGGADRTDDAGD